MSLLLLYCLHYLILLVVTFPTMILYRTQGNDHWINLEYLFLSLTHTNTDYHINHSSQHSEASTPTALEPWPWNPKLTLAWRRVLCRMPACHNPVRLRLLDHCSFQPFRIEKLVLKKKKIAQNDLSTKMYWVHLVYLPIKFCHIFLHFLKMILQLSCTNEAPESLKLWSYFPDKILVPWETSLVSDPHIC